MDVVVSVLNKCLHMPDIDILVLYCSLTISISQRFCNLDGTQRSFFFILIFYWTYRYNRHSHFEGDCSVFRCVD